MLLSVFLLLAFTRLGHECQDLLSSCDRMHVCTDQTSVYTLTRERFRGMESEPMLTPREKSPLPEKSSSEEDRTHDAASHRTASPTHYQLGYLSPQSLIIVRCVCYIAKVQIVHFSGHYCRKKAIQVDTITIHILLVILCSHEIIRFKCQSNNYICTTV